MSFIRLKDAQGRIIFIKCCEISSIMQTYPAATEVSLCSGKCLIVTEGPSDILRMIDECEKKEKENDSE